MNAAVGGHDAIVSILLDRGANIDAVDGFKRTALIWAAKEGHEKVVALLLDRGAKTHIFSRFFIRWGCCNQDLFLSLENFILPSSFPLP